VARHVSRRRVFYGTPAAGELADFFEEWMPAGS
jgi:hypothetical protein